MDFRRAYLPSQCEVTFRQSGASFAAHSTLHSFSTVCARRMKSSPWQPPPVGGGWAAHRLLGPFLLLTFLMLAASLIFLEDVRVSLRQVLTGTGTQSSFPKPTISGSVQPASAVRCNRIELPAAYYNDSQGPYNPAAIRHTLTGEWLLVYTYDEVPLCLRGFPNQCARRPSMPVQGRWV